MQTLSTRRRRQTFSFFVSILIIVGLLVQSSHPLIARSPQQAAAPAPASPTSAPPTQRAVPLNLALRELEQALLQLAEGAATDTPEFDQAKALDQVKLAWQTFQQAATATRDALLAEQATLRNGGLTSAASRTAGKLATFEQGLAGLEADYARLLPATNLAESAGAEETGADNTDWATTRAASRAHAQQLLTSVQTAAAPPDGDQAPPDFTQIIPDAIPDGQPVGHYRALAAEDLTSPVQAAQAARAPPGEADLAATEDAPLEPEIRALAAELDYDAVAIYSYVRNNVQFDPYYGSRKGALYTLWEGSGNSIDTASLLLALLRASGYPARYETGTVAVDAAQAQNWVGGVETVEIAANLFQQGGVPVSISDDGRLIIEHAWVVVAPAAKQAPPAPAPTPSPSPAPNPAPNPTAEPQANRQLFLPLVERNGGEQALAASAPAQGAQWIALDASFKQLTYREPLDLAPITGFDAEQWLSEIRAATVLTDAAAEIGSVPLVDDPEADPADEDDAYPVEYAELKAQEAYSKTLAFLEANPDLTVEELLGGWEIVAQTAATLPSALPLPVLAAEPVAEYSNLPDALRNFLTVEMKNRDGVVHLNHRASFASLANQRITVSFEAANADEQAIIDANGGTFLTAPTAVGVVPVLRLNGVEVARGTSQAPVGSTQTRVLTLEEAGENGRSLSEENSVRVGETFAVGLAYGGVNNAAQEASQQRLAATRDALPKNANGDPDLNAPGNLSEPVMGEVLHGALLAYFNQDSFYTEALAHRADVRWFRWLSAGVASQTLNFDYVFGIPVRTTGGGFVLDIGLDLTAAASLRGDIDDIRDFFQITGIYGSILEHKVPEDLGYYSVSTIRVLSEALRRGIPVLKIDAASREALLPRLDLDRLTTQAIEAALDAGLNVTVHVEPVQIGDWRGVGFITQDPESGTGGYYLSGGLAGEVRLIEGGAITSELTTIAAYGVLILSAVLGVWTLSSALAIGGVLGSLFFAAAFLGLAFDVVDLFRLTSGELSPEDYLVEMAVGLLLEAALGGLGDVARRLGVGRLADEVVQRVIRQLDEATGGAIGRLIRSCGVVAAWSDVVAQDNACFDIEELLKRKRFDQVTLDAIRVHSDQILEKFPEQGASYVERLLKNSMLSKQANVDEAMRLIHQAPEADGLEDAINIALNNTNPGFIYQLKRAYDLANPPNPADAYRIVRYGKPVPYTVTQEVYGVDAAGVPLVRALSEPRVGTYAIDIVAERNGVTTYVEAKHGNLDPGTGRPWEVEPIVEKMNQALRAQNILQTNTPPPELIFEMQIQGTITRELRDWLDQVTSDVDILDKLSKGFEPR